MHVWDGITQFNKTLLVVLNGNVNAALFRDDVLRSVVPFICRHLSMLTFSA